jgi:hypothetical protein
VVHLRAVGGAIHALEQFGVSMFIEIAGDNIQHWIRIMLSLMNSISLSVRSIAVDFVVSLLASVHRSHGSIDDITLILLTVLPEVVAREIALCSVSGLVSTFDHVETAVWPIRRAFADVEDANPLDDDRVDPELVPLLSVFCRACQAVIDGVFIELRMKGANCEIVGTSISIPHSNTFLFDADEESLLEAASFFDYENGPVQRIRWLLTLKSLHEAKGKWLEAAEALVLCAKTASDSILHLKHAWRPSRFTLWSDSRRSQWLSTVGEDLGFPNRGNSQVMEFAGNFLEPPSLLGTTFSQSPNDTLAQPTVSDICAIIEACFSGALMDFSLEKGVENYAYSRLKSLLDSMTQTIDECKNLNLPSGMFTHLSHLELPDEEALRQLCADLNLEVEKLSLRLPPSTLEPPLESSSNPQTTEAKGSRSLNLFFVCLVLTGRKPRRFLESTTVPTFLEWDKPCICRVPGSVVAKIASSHGKREKQSVEETICREFALPLWHALADECGKESVVLRIGSATKSIPEEDSLATKTFLNVALVEVDVKADNGNDSSSELQRFLFPQPLPVEASIRATDFSKLDGTAAESLQEVKKLDVANAFPCALSRQRVTHSADQGSSEAEL